MKIAVGLLFLLAAGFVPAAGAQPRESIEGIHYQSLAKPVATQTDADHIEVRDIFWYGCPQCASLEPMLTTWRDSVVGDLVFARSPAVWNDLMALHARIFYTARLLKVEDRIHRAAFTAIQQLGNPLRNEQQIKEFFIANGVGAQEFDQAWNADEVVQNVRTARARTTDYGVDKLPAVIVNGRYRVTHNAKVFDHIELNIAFNQVIRKLREERRTDFGTASTAK